MRIAVLVVLLAGCVDASDPPWLLDHDRVVAVAAEPPRIAPGQSARISALIAHAGAPVDVEEPEVMTVVSPRALSSAVHYNLDHWQIDCPPLAAPVTLQVEMRLPAGELATKTIGLGGTASNPPVSASVPDPFPRGSDVDLGAGEWFTSCGTLRGSVLRIDQPCDGELVVVVRDGNGGVAWQVLVLHAP